MFFGSLPSVSEAAPPSARFARSAFIWGGEHSLVNLGLKYVWVDLGRVTPNETSAQRSCSALSTTVQDPRRCSRSPALADAFARHGDGEANKKRRV